MDLDDAIYNMVHDYPGGVPALATRLTSIDATTGKPKPMNANTLQQKVSTNNPVAHLSPKELTNAMVKTGNLGPLHAMAQQLGQVCLTMPDLASMDGDLAVKMASGFKEFGEFMTVVAQGMAVGNITSNDLRRFQREGTEAIAAIHEVVAYATALVESAKPPHLRAAS